MTRALTPEESARRVRTGLRLTRDGLAAFRQLCRIRRYRDGLSMGETLGEWATRELAFELDRDPTLAIIAQGRAPRSAARKSTPPPARIRSNNEW